ncbi:MAG TPA: sulfatase-like hydrolase/transferase [Sphingobium sp.]|uniref:sulfatase-like hydrolase/transferase n=1 Tax=Sphingobium sp. TaxID=1912891 RepID=UPI002ED2EF87
MDFSRRQAIAAASGALIAQLATSAASAASLDAPKELPNILWLVSEDNNPFLGAYGDTLAHTPNLDALAKKGVLYRNAFSNGPVCALSRFGILTGVYPESCSPAQHMRANAHLPKELKTYPEYLRDAGYYCVNNWKEDYNCDVDAKRIWDESSRDAQWYKRPAGKPFMAVYNDFTTHESQVFYTTPGRVKPEDVRVPDYLPDTPEVRGDIASYYNRIEIMDKNCGDRLAQIEKRGVADDTIVFYYSDNGGVAPRSKHFNYDEGFRTALIIYVPPKWQHLAPAPAGSVVETPVSYIDLVPTLLSLAGQPKAAHMPGRALLGPYKGTPEKLAFGSRNRMDERYDFVRTACDGRFRYIRNYNPDRPWGINEAFAWMMKSYQSWEAEHLAGHLNPAQDRFFQTRSYEEFYDLEGDPDEIHNLIDDPRHKGRIATMRRALDQHMLAINDNGFIPEGAAGEGFFESRDRKVYSLETLLPLGERAALRNPADFAYFSDKLTNANAIIRYWAANGIRGIGTAGAPARTGLRQMADGDASVHVRIAAAHALAMTGDPDNGVAILAAILESKEHMPVRLQAVDALTLIGEPSRAALPVLKRVVSAPPPPRNNDGFNDYVAIACRYLLAVLDGTYKPDLAIYGPWPTIKFPPPTL